MPDFTRTTGFRWGLAGAAILAAAILLLFSFVYWQVEATLRTPIDRMLQANAALMADLPPDQLPADFAKHLAHDPSRLKVLGLFDRNGQRLAGNMAAVPADLPLDGRAHMATAMRADATGRDLLQVRMLGVLLHDGRILLVGRNMAEVLEMRTTVQRALLGGLLPAVLVCVLGGIVVGLRAQRRLSVLRHSAERIMRGHLVERLPTSPRGDDLDELSRIVNRMLDEIEQLLTDIKGVSEDIAHDLRTPLTRVRAQLERARDNAATRSELADVVDKAIGGLDQAIATIMALLRVAEIEHSRQQSGFAPIDLGEIVRDVGELYEPMADDKGLSLAVDAGQARVIRGDRDLLLEALANLVDNAVKFTPAGGHIAIELAEAPQGPLVRVADTGPGIAEPERQMVFRRFYRSDRSRHTEGVGLGLNLVAAVARIHGFGLRIAGAPPGCTVELTCWANADGDPRSAWRLGDGRASDQPAERLTVAI